MKNLLRMLCRGELKWIVAMSDDVAMRAFLSLREKEKDDRSIGLTSIEHDPLSTAERRLYNQLLQRFQSTT